jgi:hypothetical protein
MKALALAALVLAGCAKKQDAPPAKEAPPPAISAAEAQRARDACADYVAKVCACAGKVASLKSQCDLARAQPDAVRLDLEVAASPDSKRDDVMGAQKAMRQAVKECIEETAKLPSLGCP